MVRPSVPSIPWRIWPHPPSPLSDGGDVSAAIPDTSDDLLHRPCQTEQPIAATVIPADGFHQTLMSGSVREPLLQKVSHIDIAQGIAVTVHVGSEYHGSTDLVRIAIVELISKILSCNSFTIRSAVDLLILTSFLLEVMISSPWSVRNGRIFWT